MTRWQLSTSFSFSGLMVSLFLVLLASSSSLSQVATGTPPFASFGGGPFDTINLGNLNVHFDIPVFSKAGRGVPLRYALSYDSSVWYPSGTVGSQTWTPANSSLWGWRGIGEALAGYITYASSQRRCADHTLANFYTSWVYHDMFGTTQIFRTNLILALMEPTHGVNHN